MLFMRKVLKHIADSFFLKKYDPSPSVRRMLKTLYPVIDWKRVEFYEGLPWFTRFIAPYVTAQALPDFYSFGKFRIYLKKFDEDRAQCLADIAHEGFHVLQAHHFLKGYGFGFFRGFMIFYLALFAKQGYRMNSFEIPAYDQEYRFLDKCSKNGVHGMVPAITPNILEKIVGENDLIFKAAPPSEKPKAWLLLLSIPLCLLIALVRPIADLIVFIFVKLPFNFF